MVDHSVEGESGVQLRDDILRGVRLFAIVFAAILVCVTAYRIVRAPSEAPSAPPDAPVASEASAPVVETDPEVHPLVVPEPPPVAGAPAVKRPARKKDTEVPPPPPVGAPVVKARKAVPVAKQLESSNTVALPVNEAPAPAPVTPKSTVGYKSLVDAEPTHAPVDLAADPIPSVTDSKQTRGSRFLRAVGKLFHPGRKEAEPSSLQPRQ